MTKIENRYSEEQDDNHECVFGEGAEVDGF